MPEFTADIAHRVDGCDHAHGCKCSAEPRFGIVIPSPARDLLFTGYWLLPASFRRMRISVDKNKLRLHIPIRRNSVHGEAELVAGGRPTRSWRHVRGDVVRGEHHSLVPVSNEHMLHAQPVQ